MSIAVRQSFAQRALRSAEGAGKVTTAVYRHIAEGSYELALGVLRREAHPVHLTAAQLQSARLALVH